MSKPDVRAMLLAGAGPHMVPTGKPSPMNPLKTGLIDTKRCHCNDRDCNSTRLYGEYFCAGMERFALICAECYRCNEMLVFPLDKIPKIIEFRDGKVTVPFAEFTRTDRP